MQDNPISEDALYARAFENAQVTGNPFVIVIATDTCPPCRLLKAKVQEIKESGKNLDIVFLSPGSKYARQLVEISGKGGAVPHWYVFKWDKSKEAFELLEEQLGADSQIKSQLERYCY